jgi:single-strand DNA-binding protein
MPLPTITLAGNLTSDPQLRFTQSGTPVVTLRVAASQRIKDKDTNEWKDGDTTFLDVSCWRNAEAISEQLRKGTSVVVTGTLKQRTYQASDGTDRTTYEVNADEVALVVKTFAGAKAASAKPAAADPWANNTTAFATQDEAPF